MTHRDVDILRGRLTAIAAAANLLARHAEDLHGLAYERSVGGDEAKVRRLAVVEVDAVGDQRVRNLWHRLHEEVRGMELTMVTLERAATNLMSVGAGVEESRGSLMSKGEYRGAIRRQRQRAGRGEYTPERLIDQPDYPGTRRS